MEPACRRGKGELVQPPTCDSEKYFTGSPLSFDYEQDFFQSKASDLQFTTAVARIGVAEGRQVVQILQNVHDAHWNSDLTLKRLLVEHGDRRFCAIYQQLYWAAQVQVESASIVILGGKSVLKTMDRNGQQTWNEEYWTFDKEGRIHVDMLSLYERMSRVAPQGDRLVLGPFDLKAECKQIVAWNPKSVEVGSVVAQLVVKDGHLKLATEHWLPAGDAGGCSH